VTSPPPETPPFRSKSASGALTSGVLISPEMLGPSTSTSPFTPPPNLGMLMSGIFRPHLPFFLPSRSKSPSTPPDKLTSGPSISPPTFKSTSGTFTSTSGPSIFTPASMSGPSADPPKPNLGIFKPPPKPKPPFFFPSRSKSPSTPPDKLTSGPSISPPTLRSASGAFTSISGPSMLAFKLISASGPSTLGPLTDPLPPNFGNFQSGMPMLKLPPFFFPSRSKSPLTPPDKLTSGPSISPPTFKSTSGAFKSTSGPSIFTPASMSGPSADPPKPNLGIFKPPPKPKPPFFFLPSRSKSPSTPPDKLTSGPSISPPIFKSASGAFTSTSGPSIFTLASISGPSADPPKPNLGMLMSGMLGIFRPHPPFFLPSRSKSPSTPPDKLTSGPSISPPTLRSASGALTFTSGPTISPPTLTSTSGASISPLTPLPHLGM